MVVKCRGRGEALLGNIYLEANLTVQAFIKEAPTEERHLEWFTPNQNFFRNYLRLKFGHLPTKGGGFDNVQAGAAFLLEGLSLQG